MTDKKELSQETIDLANVLIEKISIDDEGVMTVPDSAFEESIEDDLREYVERVDRSRARFNTALTKAAGEKALPVMKEKGLKRVSGSAKVGLGSTSINITAPNGRRADGSMKDPIVTAISRQYEHPDHSRVRSDISAAWKALND